MQRIRLGRGARRWAAAATAAVSATLLLAACSSASSGASGSGGAGATLPTSSNGTPNLKGVTIRIAGELHPGP